MSGAPDPKQDDVHPFARPFLWLDKPWARRAPLFIFGVLTLALLGMDFIHPRHGYHPLEERTGFYVAMGFFGFCLAVLAGWPLRWLLGRPANYWERGGDDDA